MRHHGHGRDDAQLHIRQEGGGDDDAVAEVVDAVAQQDAQAPLAGLVGIKLVVVVVTVPLVVVAVAIELGLLQQPEGQQADQEGEEQVVRIGGAALESLGQHVQQRSAQQHAR